MTICGGTVCYDDDAYCCEDDSGLETCCLSYYYQTWWFWFIWATFLLILASCFVGCYRACRRRNHARYVILGGQQPQPYGSVVVTSNVRVPAGMVQGPSVPVAPPAYAAYPQDKPPAYAATQPQDAWRN